MAKTQEKTDDTLYQDFVIYLSVKGGVLSLCVDYKPMELRD